MSMRFVGPVPVPEPQSSPLSVLVTGAARGLGRELVKQYAEAHKDNVVFAAVRNLSSVPKEFAALPNVHVVHLDVADETIVRASVAEVQRYTDHLDVLVNNAAITGVTAADKAFHVSAAEFTQVLTTNVTGALLTIQAYLPLLRAAAEPKVVNVSSAIGSNTLPNIIGHPILSYGVSKAALNYLTSTYRYAEPKVTFVAISPGHVETDMGTHAGGKAPVTPQTSMQALRYYIQEKSLANSGEFFDIMSGKAIAF